MAISNGRKHNCGQKENISVTIQNIRDYEGRQYFLRCIDQTMSATPNVGSMCNNRFSMSNFLIFKFS